MFQLNDKDDNSKASRFITGPIRRPYVCEDKVQDMKEDVYQRIVKIRTNRSENRLLLWKNENLLKVCIKFRPYLFLFHI